MKMSAWTSVLCLSLTEHNMRLVCVVVVLWSTGWAAEDEMVLEGGSSGHYTGLGGECTQDGDCQVEHSRCYQKICGCSGFYVPDLNNARCLPVARNIDSDCIEDVQCSESWGDASECTFTGKCKCFTGYYLHLNLLRCLPPVPLGEKCNYDYECVLLDYELEEAPGRRACINSTCGCVTSTMRYGDTIMCRSSGATLSPWNVFHFLCVTSCLIIISITKP